MMRKRSLFETFFDIGTRRKPVGWLAWVIPPYAAALATWVIYSATFAIVHPWTLAAVSLDAMFGLVFLLVGPVWTSSEHRLNVVDWICSLMSIAAGVFFVGTAY